MPDCYIRVFDCFIRVNQSDLQPNCLMASCDAVVAKENKQPLYHQLVPNTAIVVLSFHEILDNVVIV